MIRYNRGKIKYVRKIKVIMVRDILDAGMLLEGKEQ